MTPPDAEPTTKEERRFWREMGARALDWELSHHNVLRLCRQVEALEAKNVRLREGLNIAKLHIEGHRLIFPAGCQEALEQPHD